MIPQVQQIAARVRELREILDKTPEQIAALISVDVSIYLAYENAESDIPVGKLYLIASALGVDPTVLLAGDSPRMNDYTIVRGGKGMSVERFAGYRFSSLAYNYIGRDMEPMIVTLEESDTAPAPVVHSGQEFNYVLSGTVAVIIDGREHILRTGDSIYFNPSLPHAQKAVGGEAKFLTVINE